MTTIIKGGSKMKIVWNYRKGFRGIRLSAQPIVDDLAQQVAENAGEGYLAVSTESPRNRARAAVVTSDAASMVDNAKNQTLLRALDATRGQTYD